jgi:hypothetical protein
MVIVRNCKDQFQTMLFSLPPKSCVESRVVKMAKKRKVAKPSPEPMTPQGIASPRISHSCFPLLTALPLDIYRELLKYLFMRDIERLDLALLNRQTREVYFAAVSGIAIPELETSSISLLHIQRNFCERDHPESHGLKSFPMTFRM